MDIDSLKNELKTLREQKEELFAKQKDLSSKIGEFIGKLKDYKKDRDELTSKVHEGKKKRDEINEDIRKLIDEVKKIQGPVPANSTMPKGMNPGRIKKEIDGIQRTIETAAVSFEKEKDLMKKLREKQKLLGQFKAKTENKGQVAQIDKQLKKLKKDSDDVHDVVQESAKKSQEYHENMLQLSKEIDALREDEAKLRDEISPLKETIKEKSKALDKYYEDNGIEKPKRVNSRPRHAKPKVDREAVAAVNEKIKTGAKLTTEDLLVLQQTDE